MQSEEFDKKVREAADHHHPAYDENAWDRMEKLLNKHLPQEKDDRRRFIFFLFLFLLLGGGSVWLFSSKPWRGSKHVTAVNTTNQKPAGNISAPVSANEENKAGDKHKLNKEDITDVSISGNDKTITGTKAPDQIASIPDAVNKKEGQYNMPVIAGINKKKQKNNESFPSPEKDQDPTDKNLKKDWLNGDQVDAATTKTTAATLIPDQKNKKNDIAVGNHITTTTNTKPGVNDSSGKENTNKNNTSGVQNPMERKEKSKSKKRNTFFFTLSAGPDVSFTGNDKLGKTRLLTGAGLGYTFKDRITIRSGFYTGRKIYTSSPESYHPPANFWNYYPNLEKVDADCRVYEIPLSLSYNFGHSSKQNWFISAGMSSYLMKKETYNYYYKYTAGGPTVQKKWTIQDENKHYFSVLTLSGGYQKNIGKSFSIMVEPYFKIPLGGVGFGKVKLNSGGILFSAGIRPFANSKKPDNTPH
jgi:hypothetical protein